MMENIRKGLASENDTKDSPFLTNVKAGYDEDDRVSNDVT